MLERVREYIMSRIDEIMAQAERYLNVQYDGEPVRLVTAKPITRKKEKTPHKDVNTWKAPLKMPKTDAQCVKQRLPRKPFTWKTPRTEAHREIWRTNGRKTAKPVVCTDADGKVTKYGSCVEAGAAVGVTSATIWAYINGKLRARNGAQWEYADMAEQERVKTGRPLRERVGRPPKAVIGTYWDGEEVKFESIAAASAAVGVATPSISAVLAGKRKKIKNMTWRYA
jgi:hypothetical protein